jgi:hypothetical protein
VELPIHSRGNFLVTRFRLRNLCFACFAFATSFVLFAAEPPTIDPFGQAPTVREDAVPGYIELSNRAIRPGLIYLTRDMRLKVYDEQLQRQREAPLQAVKQIECNVKREWMEKEWRFKETTSDEKIYTGRSYPVREYVHTITLNDDRTITGPLSAIVYVQPEQYAPPPPGEHPEPLRATQYLLNKRDKGEVGQDLKSLVYVKRIKLGKEALGEGRNKGSGVRGQGQEKR